MTKEEKIAILEDIIDGEIINPQVRSNVGIWAIKALEQSSYNSVKTDLKSCTDAISRQSAIFLASDLKQDLPDDEHLTDMVMAHNEGILEYQTQLSLLPPVTPQPKTGHWIETAEEYYKAVNEYGGGVNENTPYFVDDIACSECLAKYSVIDNETERFDHCPSCGAKMLEPQESEDKQ